jgi:hypothetical protein
MIQPNLINPIVSTGVRHPANTIEDMKKLLLGYRYNMRVEVESDVTVTDPALCATSANIAKLPELLRKT